MTTRAEPSFTRLEDDEERAAPPRSRPRPRFDHLDGTRTLMTLWVCLEHYHQSNPHMALGDARFLLNRANIPVDYYFVLSGLVTAHAYAERDFGDGGAASIETVTFYIKRFARVALSYYASIVLGLLTCIFLQPKEFLDIDDPVKWLEQVWRVLRAPEARFCRQKPCNAHPATLTRGTRRPARLHPHTPRPRAPRSRTPSSSSPGKRPPSYRGSTRSRTSTQTPGQSPRSPSAGSSIRCFSRGSGG
eukprot:1462824-Prymnesium_polylepis.2